jgi:hypothetical protein
VNAAYNVGAQAGEVFVDLDTQYASLKQKVVAGDWMKLSHADFERKLHVEGLKLLREFAQTHFTLRGLAASEAPVVGQDGNERTHQRDGTERGVTTVFGNVQARRTAYEGRGLSALHPTDADLNLPPDRYSLEVRRQVALAATHTSFETALETVERTTAAHVPKRQAEELVSKAACDFDDFYVASRTGLAPDQTSGLLVLTFDQKGVVLLTRDLRAATRKAAEQRANKFETRYSKGEPHGRKRMATVAAVYTIAPYARTAEQIIAGLRHVRDAAAPPRPRPEDKRVWARLDTTLAQVIADGFAEAASRDPERRKKWLVLIDGDPDLEALVRAEARRRGVAITVVLDFIHALEYVWRASSAFFGEAAPERETWVLDRLRLILEGRASDVVAGMTRSATLRGLDKKQRKPVDKAAKYLLKRTGLMRYDELLALGAPIATGVIEGACRHLICDRLDITGARWTLARAEAVLKLRAIASSGDFDAYWAFHEQAEWRRNHATRYANDTPPSVAIPRHSRNLRAVK